VITVDRRIGSADLERPLKKLGCQVKVATLPFGDFSFYSHESYGPCHVGIERKRVDEICQAITDTRFTGHQLPGMLKTYDVRILLVEGRYWPAPNSGLLMINGREAGFTRRRYMYSEIEHFLMSMRNKAGLWVDKTSSPADTAWWVHTCYTWYQKPKDQHKSVYAINEVKPDSAILDERTLLRKLAAQLPGIGWTRSKAVEQHFGSVHKMFTARVADWTAIEGIGEGIARQVVRACRTQRG
jgi:ERCC4-type nuclease